MYSLKERIGGAQLSSPKPILAAKQRRQLRPFFFHMGPVALCIASVLLIGLMAVLYLSQVGQAVAANQHLQDIRARQAALQRQNQDLTVTIAQEQSPEYIAQKAALLGLTPSDPKAVQILVVRHLYPIPQEDQRDQP